VDPNDSWPIRAELHVWERLPQTFFVDPELPQSREVYEITARLFDRYLASSAATSNGEK
jgi:hypothetical protein